MRVAITGANGFIGKLIMERHLAVGDTVHILTRKSNKNVNAGQNVRVFVGDLLEPKTLKPFLTDIDTLYHCAAEILDETKMHAVNVAGTQNLIEAAAGNIRHWVQLSSVGVYGQIFTGIITEDQPYNPINEYERTKLESDLLVVEGALKHKFTFSIIRPSNVFGPTMRNQSLFKLIDTINNGRFFFIGPPGASANYVPVENVVEALYLAGTDFKAANETYIVSDWCTVEEFVSIVASGLGKKVPTMRIPRSLVLVMAHLTKFIPSNPLTVSRVKALTSRTVYSTEKLTRHLGFKPVIDLRNAVARLAKNRLNN